MPPADSRLNEIGKLKNRILELESQLKEEKKISAKLRDASEKKIYQISTIDDAIAAEMESFRWKKEKILFAQSTFEEESHAKIKQLKEMENVIKQNIAGFDVIELENEKLHARLKVVSAEYMQNTRLQSAEREMRKQKNFDTRMGMEEILRKTIKNFDKNYQQEAISKMEQEALAANSENNRIHTEFDLREQKTENLIRQQQLSYEQLMKLRIERDVVAVSTEIQEKNIIGLRDQNERDERELIDLDSSVAQLRDEIANLKKSVALKAAAAQELNNLKHDMHVISKLRKKYIQSSLAMCNNLLSEGLEIAEKGRVHQNAKISQRIGRIGGVSVESSNGVIDDEISDKMRQLNDATDMLDRLEYEEECSQQSRSSSLHLDLQQNNRLLQQDRHERSTDLRQQSQSRQNRTQLTPLSERPISAGVADESVWKSTNNKKGMTANSRNKVSSTTSFSMMIY